MAAVCDKSQIVGEFLEWLREKKGWELCAYPTFDKESTRFYLVRYEIDTLLAEFFGIDLRKVEIERRALLDWIRQQSPGAEVIGR